MRGLIRASGLVAALAVAAPASAQQAPDHMSKFSEASQQRDVSVKTGFNKWCGADFACYTGIPLRCTPDTRPYQNISEHQCYCLHDSCP
jgi:hypothetical protein